jgi:hypothetical protein
MVWQHLIDDWQQVMVWRACYGLLWSGKELRRDSTMGSYVPRGPKVGRETSAMRTDDLHTSGLEKASPMIGILLVSKRILKRPDDWYEF